MGVSEKMKYLALVECHRISFLKMKKKAKSMVTVDGGLYPNFDDLYVKDHESADAFRINRKESTQPVHVRPIFVDPDFIRALIQSMKLSGNKRKRWLNLDGSNLWKYLTAIAVVGSLIYGFAVYGF